MTTNETLDFNRSKRLELDDAEVNDGELTATVIRWEAGEKAFDQRGNLDSTEFFELCVRKLEDLKLLTPAEKLRKVMSDARAGIDQMPCDGSNEPDCASWEPYGIADGISTCTRTSAVAPGPSFVRSIDMFTESLTATGSVALIEIDRSAAAGVTVRLEKSSSPLAPFPGVESGSVWSEFTTSPEIVIGFPE